MFENDITFCANSKECATTTCWRHQCHIVHDGSSDKYLSFAFFAPVCEDYVHQDAKNSINRGQKQKDGWNDDAFEYTDDGVNT